MRIACRLLARSLLLWCCSTGAARAELPDTLMEPIYHALFDGKAAATWQQLIAVWPRLHSDAQRVAWQGALNALVSRQCGNDIPVAVPAWLDSPTLALLQRDIPLNRVYRIQLSGKARHRDLRVSLLMPDGGKLFSEAPATYEADNEFRLDSPELGEPFPPGVYQLTLRSGAQTWHQPVALQGSAALNWIGRESGRIKVHLPQHATACPMPWVEQMLLRRPDFSMVWWHRADKPDQLQWPSRNDAASLWTDVSVIRAEARGGLTVRTIHRLGGPLPDIGS
ncbi:DUF2861 family protein [Collimonas humicola]|uniref:DUF2861 family protein n=1 Tax=Collimonas humicola TaxID=2825886 RepID=UPI001B8AF17B|nr:DUF2861 family protein [Collimonas humicola]